MSSSHGRSVEGSASTSEDIADHGRGIYAPMHHENSALQKQLEAIHIKLSKIGIHPYRVEPSGEKRRVDGYIWMR